MRGFGRTPHKRQPWQDNINTAPPIRPEGASGTLIPATPVRQIAVREIPLKGTLLMSTQVGRLARALKWEGWIRLATLAA